MVRSQCVHVLALFIQDHEGNASDIRTCTRWISGYGFRAGKHIPVLSRIIRMIPARPPHFASCTKTEPEMDHYIGRIPNRTLGSSTHYDGRVWYELLSSIRSVNGTPVVQGQLERSMLNQGDCITLEYQSRTYHGIVDMEASTNSNITECQPRRHASRSPSASHVSRRRIPIPSSRESRSKLESVLVHEKENTV